MRAIEMNKRSGSDSAIKGGSRVSRCRATITLWKVNLGSLAVRRLWTIAFLFLSLGAAPHINYGQITNVTNDQATPIPGVGHNYIGDLNDIVNPSNGSLSVRIGVPMPPSRGLNLPFTFDYDSAGLITVAPNSYITCYQNGWCQYTEGRLFAAGSPSPSPLGGGGWWNSLPELVAETVNLPAVGPNNAPGPIYCTVYTGFMFTDMAGSRHSMTGMALADTSQYSMCAKAGITPVISHSGEDEFYKAVAPSGATNPSQVSISVMDSAGTLFHFPAYPNPCTGYCAFPDYIEDKNGNTVRISIPYTNNGFPVSVTDTAGRNVLTISSYGSASGDTVTVSGQSAPYTVQWESVPYSFTISSTAVPDQSASCFSAAINPTSGTRQEVSSIGLPNGLSYKFGYDPIYGLLNKITYPSGAYVSYVWGPSNNPSDWVNYENVGTMAGPGEYIAPNLSCFAEYNAISVQKRTVSFDGVHIAQQQSFNYQTTWQYEPQSYFGSNIWMWVSKTTTVTTTDYLRPGDPSYQTTYTYLPAVVPNPPNVSTYVASEAPQENTITYNDWAGATLRTVTKTWENPGFQSSLLAKEQTALGSVPGNSQTSLTNYSYSNNGFPLIAEEDEYGYGAGTPGGLSRKTVIDYASFSATPLGTSLNNLPCQSIVYDGSNNRLAETDTLYDGGTAVCGAAGTSAVTSVSNLPAGTHDEVNYSASVNPPRGNATKVTHKCFAASSACTDASTTYAFDETGQILSATDPCGNASCSDMSGSSHTTTYSYADSYVSGTPGGNTNTYVTKITKPTVNGITPTSTYSYSYAGGTLASAEDVNNNATTKYYYNTQPSQCSQADMMNRLSEVDYPDKGIIQYCYNDSVPSMTTSTLLASSTWKTSVSTMDGLGHTIETQLTSDPDGTDTVLTSYDGEGHVFTKTNPFRGATPPVGTTSTFYYDALGRPIETQEPDGNVLQWCYSGVASTPAVANCSKQLGSVTTGTWIDSSDEKGNHWQRTTDALGRLTEVLEPSGSAQTPSMETDYSYDALSNLISVTQWGGASGSSGARTRSFSYDSLSRLLSATNPETGTVAYTFDANGNVSAKTDARGVVTNFGYDALGRLLSKTYTGAPAGTMANCYQYDTAANGVGRLGFEWTQSAGCPTPLPASPPTGGYQSLRVYGAYDAMGRAQSEQQCAAGYCTTASVPSQPTNCPTLSSGAGLQYCYDLAGNLLAYGNGLTTTAAGQYPQHALLFAQTFDAAGRLATVGSSWSDLNHAGTLFNASSPTAYTPSSALWNWQLGAQLTIGRSYDPARLWVTGQKPQ